MAIELIDLVSGYKAEVNAYRRLKVALAEVAAEAGFAALLAESDPGDPSNAIDRKVVQLDADDDYRLRVGIDTREFIEPFGGAALNSAVWTAPVTTFTVAVANAYAKLNAAVSAAANGVARISTWRTFSVEHAFPLYIEAPLQVVAAQVGILNTTVEFGWGIASGTTAPTDGVAFTINASGEARLIAYYNGTPNQSPVIDLATDSVLAANKDARVLLVIGTTRAELWIDNRLRAVVARSPALPSLTQASSLPVFARVYNAAVAPASATALWVGGVTVSRGGNTAKHNGEMAAGSGWGGFQALSGGTYTANRANSAAPASATLSNTAAGYTTLGGQWQFVAVAGAETDFALFAFLVPAAAAGGINKNFRVTRLRIDATVLGAAIATTATVLQWGIAVGATQVTLATVADTATVKQARRIPVGLQTFVVGDPIGARVEAIDVEFEDGLFCAPGEYIHIILKVPLGTATASQIFRGTCYIGGKFVD